MDDMAIVWLRYGEPSGVIREEKVCVISEVADRIIRIANRFASKVGMPYSVDVVREGEGVLTVGVGTTGWTLSSIPDDGGVVMNSLGDMGASGFVKMYFGDVTLMSAKYLVPRDAAIAAIQDWCRSGELSDAVAWTDENFSD